MSTFLRAYSSYCQDVTDAPLIYHEFTALATIAAAVGMRVRFPWGDTHIHPNLYAVLLGESTAFRKTTCLRISRQLLWDFDKERILPDDFSYEALFDAIARTPSSIAYFEEFENLMGKAARENMSQLKGFLTTLYDCPRHIKKSLRGLKKKGQSPEENTRTVDTIITDPCLTILAGSTIEWLIERLTEEDFRSGFMARFLLVPAGWRDLQAEMSMPMRADADKRSGLITILSKITQLHGDASLADPDAFLSRQSFFSDAYTPRSAKAGDRTFEPYFERLKTVALKIAMLHHLSTVPTGLVITDESSDYAWKAANWLAQEIIKLKPRLSFTPYSKAASRIEEALREHPMTQSQLLRLTHLKGYELATVLAAMEESDEIVAERIGTKTKPTRLWHSCSKNGSQRADSKTLNPEEAGEAAVEGHG